MIPRIGFDNERYLREQKAAILERVKKFNDKLYLEFGGKLLYDYHAARVLPGYDPNVKMLTFSFASTPGILKGKKFGRTLASLMIQTPSNSSMICGAGGSMSWGWS